MAEAVDGRTRGVATQTEVEAIIKEEVIIDNSTITIKKSGALIKFIAEVEDHSIREVAAALGHTVIEEAITNSAKEIVNKKTLFTVTTLKSINQKKAKVMMIITDNLIT